ncbi:MAG: lytic murein transglycosylase [Defluviicoccus sp.]
MKRILLNTLIAAVLVFGLWPAAVFAADTDFDTWLTEFRGEARAAGIRDDVFDRVLGSSRPIEKIVELDRRQPEFVDTFWQYLGTRVTPERVGQGRAQLHRHRNLLQAIEQHYRVPAAVLVSFWALETDFGGNTGQFRAADALATLAYDGRRGAFFREQLLALLQLVQAGDVPAEARASWAGALGQMQFMPTTYRAYAVDFDGDGRRDLWHSMPDAFASAANYLASIGWDGTGNWGEEVRLPADFDYYLAGTDVEMPLVSWRDLGVVRASGAALEGTARRASIVLPGGAQAGPALLVSPNFRVIMAWNRAINYAVTVGHLADRIAGRGPFVTRRLDDGSSLSRTDVIEMQMLLGRLGFDAGGADGVVGSRTRDAIRDFQRTAFLPADGFPSPGLLDRLRVAAAE